MLAVTRFDLVIATLTTLLPSLIYKIYPFYSAVGVAGITELITGHEDLTERIGSFGNFGCILIAIILAATPIRRLFSIAGLGRLAVSALASLSVVYSGYRSALANFVFTILAAGYRDLRLGFSRSCRFSR